MGEPPVSRPPSVRLILEACRAVGLVTLPQQAYVLATAEHETAGTLQPVKEGFFLGDQAEAFRRRLRYYPYYGRGYVQLTWRRNYRRFGDLLGIDLEGHPDLALEPRRAAWIMATGFKQGLFTGKKLEDYVVDRKSDFKNARRCINGLDCAEQIAALAESWRERLSGERPAAG